MKRLSKRDFMEFAVSLPEDGDVDGMQQMLDDNPEHKDELLFGERDGVSDGNYSAWSYSTWLCHFEKYRENARRVVKWLIKKGRRRDLWSAIALEEKARLKKILEENSKLSRAEHPLFGDTALELALPKLRPLLLEHGADDGSLGVALLLEDLDRIRQVIRREPELLQDPEQGPDLLFGAICNGQDDFACELIDLGVDIFAGDHDFSLLCMAACWGTPRATRALLALGANPNEKSGRFTPLSMCASRCNGTPEVAAEIVAALLEAGAEPRPRAKIEGETVLQWCEKKGFDQAAELIREAGSKFRSR